MIVQLFVISLSIVQSIFPSGSRGAGVAVLLSSQGRALSGNLVDQRAPAQNLKGRFSECQAHFSGIYIGNNHYSMQLSESAYTFILSSIVRHISRDQRCFTCVKGTQSKGVTVMQTNKKLNICTYIYIYIYIYIVTLSQPQTTSVSDSK